MSTLKELWDKCGQDPHQKFRFIDWNHKTKYFQIIKLLPDGQSCLGRLDCGENLTLSLTSDFWVEYFPGDENRARAV